MTRRVPNALIRDFGVLARPDLRADVEMLVRRLWDEDREDALRSALAVLRAAREALDAHRADWRTRAKDDAIRVAATRRGDPPVTWREVEIGGRAVRVGRARPDHAVWRGDLTSRDGLVYGTPGAPVPTGPGNPEKRIRAAARADLRCSHTDDPAVRARFALSARDAALLVRALS